MVTSWLQAWASSWSLGHLVQDIHVHEPATLLAALCPNGELAHSAMTQEHAEAVWVVFPEGILPVGHGVLSIDLSAAAGKHETSVVRLKGSSDNLAAYGNSLVDIADFLNIQRSDGVATSKFTSAVVTCGLVGHGQSSPPRKAIISYVEEERVLRRPSSVQSVCSVDDTWYSTSNELGTFDFLWLDYANEPYAMGFLPLDYCANEPSVLGAVFRYMTANYEPSAHVAQGPLWTRSDIDVISVTTLRWRSVRMLLSSIRKNLGPDVGITVVVQGPQTLRWRLLEAHYRAQFIHVAHDTGLSECRNVAIRNTNRPLVLLTDDDFHIDERCRIDDALALLEKRPEIDILGGNLLDVTSFRAGLDGERSQGFALKLVAGLSETVWVRLEDLERHRVFVSPSDYYELCDVVDNFALLKRARVFERGLCWNPQLKINAEHQDFYLRVLAAGDVVVARTNALKVRNVRIQSRGFKKLRYRTSFFSIFFRGWGIKSVRIVGDSERVCAPNGWVMHRARGFNWRREA